MGLPIHNVWHGRTPHLPQTNELKCVLWSRTVQIWNKCLQFTSVITDAVIKIYILTDSDIIRFDHSLTFYLIQVFLATHRKVH